MEMVTLKTKFPKYPAYKDSGEEWLGEIPEEWDVIKLGSLLKNFSEKNHPSLPLLSITREKGVIVRDVEDDSENHNFIPDDLTGYKLLRKGQFGMNKMKAWQGSYGVSPKTGIVSPAYYIFDFTKPVLPSFFHSAIRSKRYVSYFGSASDGVRIGQWDLSKDRMKKIPFFLPSLPEQTAIANFLDDKTAKIDQAIAQKEKMIALLKERKQIIIQNAVTKGLDPNVKMKDSGVEWIGEIPEEWEVCAVKYTLSIPITDGPHTTPLLLDEGYPFISAEAIKNGEIDFNKKRGFISEKNHKDYCKKYKPQKGDIYMVKSGATTGNIAMVDTDEEFSIWSPLAVFRADPTVLSNSYLYNFLESYSFKKGVELKWSFGTQQNIGMGVLSNLFIAFGKIEEQKRIVEHIKNCSVKISKIIFSEQTQIEKLKEYKATLIDSAVTGKIKVS